MLLRALRPFTSHPDVALVVIAVPAGVATRPPEWLATLVGERLALVAGGASRAQSVRAGLAALPAGAGVVLVHDGARTSLARSDATGLPAGHDRARVRAPRQRRCRER